MVKDFGLTIEGAGFTHNFDNEISSVNYTTSILMGDNIALDTLDITLKPTSFKDQNIYQYFRSLEKVTSSDPKNLVATFSVGKDFSTKFYNIADAQPAGISFKDITEPFFRMTTFPKKTAKSYDSMQAIYQQKSLFEIFKSVMRSNSVPDSNVSIIGEDIIFADDNETYNMFKAEGVSTLEFIRKLCLYYGYAIINRDNKIKLLNLIDIEKQEPAMTINLEDLTMENGVIKGLPEGLVSFLPKANLEPVLEAISIIKQDPILESYKISTLKNPGVQNVTYQNKGGYITTKEFMPERTLVSRAKAIIREAQQKLRRINIVYSKIINIFAGDTVKITCYENYFSKTYLVLETSHYADRKTMKTSMVLIENFNTADFGIDFKFDEING